MEDCQRDPEHDFVSFEENEVPKSLKHFEVEVVGEETGEPLQSSHARLVEALLKVGSQSRELLCD